MEQKTEEKIQWQCNVNTSERTCILRPDHAKKSTQQNLCIILFFSLLFTRFYSGALYPPSECTKYIWCCQTLKHFICASISKLE